MKLKSGFTPKRFHFGRVFLADPGGIWRRNPRLAGRLNRVRYKEVIGTRNFKKSSKTTVRRDPKFRPRPIAPKIAQFWRPKQTMIFLKFPLDGASSFGVTGGPITPLAI